LLQYALEGFSAYSFIIFVLFSDINSFDFRKLLFSSALQLGHLSKSLITISVFQLIQIPLKYFLLILFDNLKYLIGIGTIWIINFYKPNYLLTK